MISIKENIAHNTRLNGSLETAKNQANSSAAFSLYLSMLHPDVSQYSRFSQRDGEHESSYSSIEKGAYRHARKYARPDDYSNANALNYALNNAYNKAHNNAYTNAQQHENSPMLLLAWYQTFFPQALHYKREQQQIPDEVKANMVFFTQHPSSLVEDDVLSNTSENLTDNVDETTDMYNTVTDAKKYSF